MTTYTVARKAEIGMTPVQGNNKNQNHMLQEVGWVLDFSQQQVNISDQQIDPIQTGENDRKKNKSDTKPNVSVSK